MKSYPAVLSFYSTACCLVLAACSSSHDPLFEDVGAPQAEPDDMQTPGMEPDVEDPPVVDDGIPEDMDDMAMQPPDNEMPLDGDTPIEDGSGDDGSDDDDDDDDPPVVVDPPDEPAPEPEVTPTIIDVFPDNGANGVDGETSIVIIFSVPMNQAATEAAYQSEGIPSSGVTFSWNDAGTELTVIPDEPLEYDSGPDPETVEARRYSYFVSSIAEDLEGNQLGKTAEFSFSVLRQIEVAFAAVQDRNLTGNWRSDGTYAGANAECARNTTNICVGDAGDNDRYQGFITFDLSTLPTTMSRISEASLNLQVTGGAGNPFGQLGRLMLDHTRFNQIGVGAFTGQPLGTVGPVPTQGAGVGTLLSLPVLDAVASDAESRALSQYRLRFEAATDNDENQDIFRSSWTTQRLNVKYLTP